MTTAKQKPISEAKESMALIKWAKLKNIRLVHIANEGERSRQYGASLVRQGLSKGFPDLLMASARGGYFGMFIEMKQKFHYTESEKAKQSWKNQEEWLSHLRNQGYFAFFAYGWEDAKSVIEMYMKWPVTLFNPLKNVL